MDILLLLNLVVTSILCGLIWTVQLVHYPSFHFIQQEKYKDFQIFHEKRISIIVLPLMLIEAFLSAYLLVNDLSIQNIISFILLLIIWCSTILIQMPLHSKLETGYNINLIKKLVNTNWIRTIAWSIKLLILFYYSL